MTKLPIICLIPPAILRLVTGVRRWLQAVFAVWLALLVTALLLVLMNRLALVPVALADEPGPQVVVTKTIDPSDLVSGQSAVISFTLSGVSNPQPVPHPIDVALVIDVSGSMSQPTGPKLVTGAFVSDDAWEPAYTFSIEYPITDTMRATATHPIRFVWHGTPTTYYPDPGGDVDVRVPSVIPPGDWTVEILRAGGAAEYTVAVYVPETRLPAATYAAKLFVGAISDTDQVAVVPFKSNSWVAQSLTSSRPAIHSALDGLMAGGTTRIDNGISVAHTELITSGHALNGSKRAMVVMSDGRQFPPHMLDAVFLAAQAAADDGVIIYTIGFGADADAATLMTIADIGCGRYYFAPDSQSLQQIYLDIAHDLRGRVARSMLIYDILPSGVTLLTGSLASGWSYELVGDQTVVTYPINDSFCIHAERVYTLPVRIDWEAGTSGPVNAPGSGITVTTLSSITTFIPFTNPIATVGGLLLDKQGPSYAYPGQMITYTLWVTNPGPMPVSDVCLGDLLGSEATVTGASHGGQEVVISDTTVWVWDLDTIATNTVLSRSLVARVNEGVANGTPLWDVAGVAKLSEGTCTAPVTGELIASDIWLTTIITTGLSAGKVSEDVTGPPLYPNDTLVYTVTVINTADALVHTNVVITDNIPSSTTFVADSAQSNGDVTVVGDTIVAQIDQLGPGQALTLTFRVTVNPDSVGDTIVNQAQVTSDQQPNPPQPSPTTDDVATLMPGLTLNKWVTPDFKPPPCDAFPTYHFQITNTGDIALTDITIWDDKLGFIGNIVNLPLGETRTLSKPMNIAGDMHNLATATTQIPGFPGPLFATDEAYFDCIQGPLGLSLDVSAQPNSIPTAQMVTYTYRLTNIGADRIEEGVITDTLSGTIASGLSLVPGESYTQIIARWIATTTVTVAHAWGTDALGSNQATATATATVTVGGPGGPFYLPVIVKGH
jgi:uncharacterized repeat protein (TIGR01451 family)